MNGHQLIFLLIEDNPGHARLIEKNLRRANVVNPIKWFETGQAALDYLFTDTTFLHPPEQTFLVLLDLNLPDMSGVEVLRRLKQEEETRAIPVIILTTTDEPREIETCYRLGCNIYITKPVDYGRFMEAIRRLGLFLSVITLPNS
ncbi:MAG: response regulator [Bacteroidetes bacterium]|nr:MAG: response regulator [Bacteroidota bacterium]